MRYKMANAGSGGLPCGGADSTYESTVFVSAAGEEIAVTTSEMEVHALRVVKQEENTYEFDFPQSVNHTNERQYHDPTGIQLPLEKFQRALNPPVEQLSATLQTTSNVETDNVHHTNDLERLAVAASDVFSTSELEEPPNARATEKGQVVAEMVEFAFATCEGSNYNPGTRMMVSNLLQFLSKQYEEDKALAVVEIGRLKDEKMKLEEQRNLALGNFQKSESELEELKKGVKSSRDSGNENEELRTVIATMGADMEELKKGVKSSRDLELENEELRIVIATMGADKELKKGVKSSRDLELENEELKTMILTMGADMDVLKKKYNKVQSENLSTKKCFEKLVTERASSLQQVNQLKATIRDRDKKIDLQNEEMTVLRERVGKETYHIPETTSNPPIVSSELKQVPPKLSQCDPVTEETEGPMRKKTRCNEGLDCESVSISRSMNVIAPQKFGAQLSGLLTAIMTLGKTLDCKTKVLNKGSQFSREFEWNLIISRIAPPGHQLQTNPIFKMVWNHWISAVMFHDFEDTSFGSKEEAVGTPENPDALIKLGKFDGKCSRFLAFVKRKHQLLFPPWMYRAPLLKLLDADVYSKFKVIAEKIWMLHQVGRGFDLPPHIFRPVPLGTCYDTQYHESRTPLPEGTENATHVIMLVFMPGFVVGETVIKSQVSVKKM